MSDAVSCAVREGLGNVGVLLLVAFAFCAVILPVCFLPDVLQQLRNKKWMKQMKEEEKRLKDLSGEDGEGPAGGDGANWKGKHGCGGGSL